MEVPFLFNNNSSYNDYLLNKMPQYYQLQAQILQNNMLSSMLNNSCLLVIPNQNIISDENKLLNLMNTLHQKNTGFDLNQGFLQGNKNLKTTSKPKEETSTQKPDLLQKKRKKSTKVIDNCPHTNLPHYAKGMCSNCYHTRGRNKAPWNCPHKDKFHYALGLCQNCYQFKYIKRGGKPEENKENKEKQNEQNSLEEQNSDQKPEEKKEENLKN